MAQPRRPGGPAGPRRPGGRQRPTVAPGTEPTPPPIVLTIGSSIQFADAADTVPISATLIGSINTQGQSGTWWFSYGTSSSGLTSVTSTFGSSASTIPQTVTAVLTGLVPGQTYVFETVGQTPGGLVSGAQLSFVYSAPSVPATPGTTIPNPSPSSLTIPHLEFPFKIVSGTPHVRVGSLITSSDGARVVQQDSDGDVMSCVSAIVSCEVGQWPENPSFGIYDEAFKLVTLGDDDLPELDTLGLTSAIQRWEPRATVDVVTAATQGDVTGGDWTMGVEVGGTPA